jgi:hypothetical protein
MVINYGGAKQPLQRTEEETATKAMLRFVLRRLTHENPKSG